MKKEDAEEFTQSLEQIVSGAYRQTLLAETLGVAKALGLSKDQWANRLSNHARFTPVERKKIATQLLDEGVSKRAIGRALGVDKRTVGRDIAGAKAPPSEQDQGESNTTSGANAPAGKSKQTRKAYDDAMRVVSEKQTRSELENKVHVGDFRDLAGHIPEASVDLILTDPPYDRDSVGLYADAAKEAARVLKPGGSFIAYGGQYLLPEILAGCSQHLRLWWINACIHTGQLARMTEYGVVVKWKPLVWFVKGTRGDKLTFIDDAIEGQREKFAHPWQQAEEEASYYIEKLTIANGLIVDFFLGGGTTAVAAQKLGRRWIGFEIDGEHAARAEKRINEFQKEAA